jgi:hypothetical protein
MDVLYRFSIPDKKGRYETYRAWTREHVTYSTRLHMSHLRKSR